MASAQSVSVPEGNPVGVSDAVSSDVTSNPNTAPSNFAPDHAGTSAEMHPDSLTSLPTTITPQPPTMYAQMCAGYDPFAPRPTVSNVGSQPIQVSQIREEDKDRARERAEFKSQFNNLVEVPSCTPDPKPNPNPPQRQIVERVHGTASSVSPTGQCMKPACALGVLSFSRLRSERQRVDFVPLSQSHAPDR